MLPSDLLSWLLGTRLSPTDCVLTPDLIVVALASRARAAPCPVCGRLSDRPHNRYRRVLADLPLCGRQLVLILRLRKFLCPNAGCPRHIFWERVPALTAAHDRSTTRWVQLQRTLGMARGGEAGARLADELARPTSGDTILRRVKATPTEPEPSYRFVGIDDFALRQGHTSGTILVDLQRGRVIDLFDGRDGTPVEMGLRSHPGIEVITRDRWAAYANACAAAPTATQVADRFHLLSNIRELVERLFDHHTPAVDAFIREGERTALCCTAGSEMRGAGRRTVRSCGSWDAGSTRPGSHRSVRAARRRVRLVGACGRQREWVDAIVRRGVANRFGGGAGGVIHTLE